MTLPSNIDPTKVTFSQAHGLEPLPSQLALGELSDEARSVLWVPIYTSMAECVQEGRKGMIRQDQIRDPWRSIMRDHHVYVDHMPIDDFVVRFEYVVEEAKSIILESPYNEVMDFVQFILRHDKCPYALKEHTRAALSVGRTAYTIIDDGPTVIAIAEEQEIETIETAFADIHASGIVGAREHLRKAAEDLTAGEWA